MVMMWGLGRVLSTDAKAGGHDHHQSRDCRRAIRACRISARL
jgi:hypothetical protein